MEALELNPEAYSAGGIRLAEDKLMYHYMMMITMRPRINNFFSYSVMRKYR